MLVQALLESADRFPDKLALADHAQKLTYAQLVTLTQAIRRVISEATTCERVGVMLPASCGTVATIFGGLWAGKTVIPLNFLLQPHELRSVIEDAGIDLVVGTVHFKPLLENLPVRALYLEEAGLKRRYVMEKLRRRPPIPQVDPDDVAVIVYTSGTTGTPKGVCLSYRNFHWNAQAAIDHLKIQSDEHLLGLVPPFHVFGLTVLNFLPIILGGTVTYIPRFSPQAACKAIAEDGITILLAVPSMYAAIARLKSIEPATFSRIRISASGGEPLPRNVYDAVLQRTGLKLIEGYGLTETSPIISADLPWAHKPGTVGTALAGIELQLRDDSGTVLPRDAEGELWVRGPGVMKGYYRKPEETARVIDADGWFRTGDIVRIDDEAYISITGRAKDLIIVGGENVYPREVESVLEMHPSVQ